MAAKPQDRKSPEPTDETKRLREELADLQEVHETLRQAGLKMLRAVHGNAFIIPNGGSKRDRAITAWDGLKEALGLKNSDLAGLTSDDVVEREDPAAAANGALPPDSAFNWTASTLTDKINKGEA